MSKYQDNVAKIESAYGVGILLDSGTSRDTILETGATDVLVLFPESKTHFNGTIIVESEEAYLIIEDGTFFTPAEEFVVDASSESANAE